MNRENLDALIQSFGVACANIDSVLEKLNTYGQEIVDGVSDTEDTREKCTAAILRVVSNTTYARHSAVDMKLHLSKDFRNLLTLLRNSIIKMQTAFDEAKDEIGEDKLPLIETAIDQATFAKRNCDKIYTTLTTMSVEPNNKNNKGNNKGGSRILRKKRHAKRTAKRHTRK
jgi:hypothetical protein